ncbi:hypothetical protein [Mycolicibacterium litorale]|uniref:Mce-associated membrane protein n=1 Tax=Mycolicibacterium litorale TaxID=758802 RepID=A0AAD1MTJ1_9MYCO|nr:hypothetical protein [Mycolicibacterium litorale]MCV7417201.1 hypothetical protein [Mycolicibacterium litorale]TDY04989.1 hypothetical protein BCL50_3771 [Mycolicibacterium litorale]BBY18419.1 hypothetical protein MLIT_40110 [Mycolicibacterium litorale]
MREELTDEQVGAEESTGERVFTGFGIASAVLAALSVAAIVLAVLIWSGHRADSDERAYQTRVMQAAADWTGVLVNMNKDTVDASMQRLHENTIGELNADFDSAVEPYRQLVQRLQTRTTGQIDSVSIESLHHPAPGPDGGSRPAPPPDPQLSAFAERTDTVLVVATSISENAGNQEPQTVRWTLRLDVSDVDGKLMISRLEPIR